MERLRKNFVKFFFLSVTLVYVCVCDHRNKFEGVFNGKKRIFKEVMRLLKVVILFSLFYFNFLRFVISLIFLNVLSTVYFNWRIVFPVLSKEILISPILKFIIQ